MIKREGSRLLVSGRLTMETIGASFAEAMLPLEGKEWTVDLAGVEVADSAAVSLLLGWLRNAQQHEARLNLVNVPESMRSLAGLYGVADALPLNPSPQ
jgi:phospholipid transport system transporter-binding protein